MNRPRVLVVVLTGTERHFWLNPDLSLNLFRMASDSRFEVCYFPVRDFRPVETARNAAIHAARQIDASWMISFDNDGFAAGNPLDIIAAAGPEQHIIGLPSGLASDGGAQRYRMYPPPDRGLASDGPFREEYRVASGVLMIRNTVWNRIPAPWFRWVHGDNELLTPDGPGFRCEIEYFCDLARQHGFKLWGYDQPAGHFRTTDITGMVHTMAQLQAKEAAR